MCLTFEVGQQQQNMLTNIHCSELNNNVIETAYFVFLILASERMYRCNN